jgi:arsenate reductase
MQVSQKKIKILFLCTANSCRSQMAEGWARHLKSEIIEPYSAGVAPAKINSRAIAVMKEAGVDISRQHSKHVEELASINFDYVVTVCDNAREQCPVFTGKANVLHAAFEDPAVATGTPEEVLNVFRKIRDQIKGSVAGMAAWLEKQERKDKCSIPN